MAVRTTVDIPEPLHARLRERAEKSETSIPALILRAIEQTYSVEAEGDRTSGPLVKGPGKLGPRFPEDENPHDLVLS